MGVRVRSLSFVGNASVINPTRSEVVDSTQSQREATVDGYTFHFGPNEVKNFLDDGVGAAVAAFGADGIREDEVAFGDSRS